MKIAIFGGSFNPVHNGHIEIINSLIEEKTIDEIWVVPCGNHSFNKDLISGSLRLEMLRLAIDSSKIKISEYELNKKEKSFSADMIRDFKKEYPQNQFLLVIGADNLEVIDKWHDFDYLKKEVEFIVIGRPGYELKNIFGIKIKKIIDLKKDISSTRVREEICKGISNKKNIPIEVYNYIKKNKLYARENAIAS